MNYLERATRSDISHITHKCARFTSDPKVEYAKAIMWLVCYLKVTRDKGFIFKPTKGKDMEVFIDADFSGNWESKESQDRDIERYRHGYIISYKG